MKYTGPTVDTYREEKDRQEKMVIAFEKEIARRKVVKEKKMDKAATKIQSFIRSVRSRIVHQEFIEERRIYMELRKEEAGFRESRLYKALGLIGFQPFFRSDTPKERLAKMYPSYLMNIIEESVDGDWSLAYRLIRDQEEFEWMRDAETIKRSRAVHKRDHSSSHARLMALRQKRLSKPTQNVNKPKPRMRRRGKGYVRYHRSKCIARGREKIAAENLAIEAEMQV
jgi:hypothetical protein